MCPHRTSPSTAPTGHTGRLVAAELHARGREVILAGRDGAALKALSDELGGARVHQAALDDPAALRALAAQASVPDPLRGSLHRDRQALSRRPLSRPAATT
ncbi:hypothetical protein [Nonomuraea dietziae]|uniref:hypothetical protein n=1 Tax=Nonomuraea dietziae TaxID=65515 RepID=UPI0031DB08FC